MESGKTVTLWMMTDACAFSNGYKINVTEKERIPAKKKAGTEIRAGINYGISLRSWRQQ